MKRCCRCKAEKPEEDFYVCRTNARDGRQSRCIECQRSRQRKGERQGNNVAARQRAWYLLNQYGISMEQYDLLLSTQNHVCAICARPCSTGRSLAVDHDHATGAIRGLLCRRCNTTLGLFDENPAIFDAMATYLRDWSHVDSV